MIHHVQILPGHHHGGHKTQFLEEFEAQSGACVLALVHVHVEYHINIKDCRMVFNFMADIPTLHMLLWFNGQV
jgi:hypothetical protein